MSARFDAVPDSITTTMIDSMRKDISTSIGVPIEAVSIEVSTGSLVLNVQVRCSDQDKCAQGLNRLFVGDNTASSFVKKTTGLDLSLLEPVTPANTTQSKALPSFEVSDLPESEISVSYSITLSDMMLLDKINRPDIVNLDVEIRTRKQELQTRLSQVIRAFVRIEDDAVREKLVLLIRSIKEHVAML